MKVVDYKQLCRLPAGTLISTINKMNETGELLLIGINAEGVKVLYSPRSAIDGLGEAETPFDENVLNRNGSFKVYTTDEVMLYRNRLIDALNGTWKAAIPEPSSEEDGGCEHDARDADESERASDDEIEPPQRIQSCVVEDEEDHFNES